MDEGIQAPAAQSESIEQEGARLRAEVEQTPFWEEGDSDANEKPERPTDEPSEQDQQLAADATDKPKAETPTAQDEGKTRNSEPSAELEAEAPTDEIPASTYARLKKEHERLMKDWETRRQEAKEQREAIKQLSEQFSSYVKQSQQAPKQAPNSQDYITAAKEFEQRAKRAAAEGNTEEVDKYLDLAARSRDAAQQSYWQGQQEQFKTQQSEFDKIWAGHMNSEIEKWPELGDPNSEDARTMNQLLDNNPEFLVTPNGFTKAVQVLKWMKQAAESSGLREENEKIKKELSELQKRTSIGGGGVQQRTPQKGIDEMDMGEAKDFLRKQLEDADAEMVASW